MMKKVVVLSSLFSLLFIGCQKQSQESAVVPQAQQVIKIGFQKSSLNSIVLKHNEKILHQFFPHVQIEWKEFPAGPQMLEALSVGSIDLGSVGNTPPIFAQAADKNIEYVAYENVHPLWQAVLISQGSDIKRIEQLKGKKVAVQKGSSAHDLLGRVLQKAHLNWSDIEPVWLAPADARAALDKKAVDAWVIWEPFLTAAQIDSHAQSLIDGSSFENTYNFLIGQPKFLKSHPQETQKFIQANNQAAKWVVTHPQETLDLYGKAIGLSPEITQKVLDKKYKPALLLPINQTVIDAQQHIADRFTVDHVIPHHISIVNATTTASTVKVQQ